MVLPEFLSALETLKGLPSADRERAAGLAARMPESELDEFFGTLKGIDAGLVATMDEQMDILRKMENLVRTSTRDARKQTEQEKKSADEQHAEHLLDDSSSPSRP